MTHVHRCFFKCSYRFQQRGFIIQRSPVIGNKNGGDTQCFSISVFYDKGGRRRVPCCITSRFKCGTNTSIGEARGIGLLLNQCIAIKQFNCCTITFNRKEGVVFFCRSTCKGLEPVAKVGKTAFICPSLHPCCYLIGHFTINFFPSTNRTQQTFVGLFGKVFTHSAICKYVVVK